EEMQNALNAVAFADGRPQPVVLRALTDKQGVRRAAAARALCAGGRSDQVGLVRPLLTDAELSVRLKVALALAGARERVAVPTLIALMTELPSELAPRAEEYLSKLAKEEQPKGLPAGPGKEARKKRSEIWSAWWEANKD